MPLNAAGVIDEQNGMIGFISIGMSNTSQEFGVFETIELANASKNPKLRVLNTAQGGQSADRINSAGAAYWQFVLNTIAQSGMTPAQAQVVWVKQAHANPLPTFPDHALALEDDLRWIVRHLKTLFPNVKLCYFSGRIFGGYSGNIMRSEPVSFETSLSVKWLIEDQIAGNPALNFDAALGPVESPLLLWSAYIWANGASPRSDGLVWLPADYQTDMVHPSDLGRLKVANMLLDFFSHDSTTQAWHEAPCPGDANGDNTVNFADVTSVLGNWGANYGFAADGAGDTDASGAVNFADVTSVLANWGAACPP